MEDDAADTQSPAAPRARRSPRRAPPHLEPTNARTSPLPTAPAPATQRVGNSRTAIQVNLYGRLLGGGRNTGASPAAAANEEAPAAACPLPDLAAMERQRTVKRKPPEGARGRQKAIRTTKETVVPLERRLTEFPNECLKISAGKLFCLSCKEELPNLKERIKRHTSCAKHQDKKAEFQRASKANSQLFSDLADHFTTNSHESGVSDAMRPSTVLSALIACCCVMMLCRRVCLHQFTCSARGLSKGFSFPALHSAGSHTSGICLSGQGSL